MINNMMNDKQLATFVETFKAGFTWAKALKTGDTFLGCAVEAEKQFHRDSADGKQLQHAFISGAMNGLGDVAITTDSLYKIVAIEPYASRW